MPSNVFSKENSKLEVSVTRGICTTGKSCPAGAGAGAAANLELLKNCVKGVGAGEWGTSRFIPKCVASGSGSSTKWAPKSMVLYRWAPLGRPGRLLPLAVEAARLGPSAVRRRVGVAANVLRPVRGAPAAASLRASRRSLAPGRWHGVLRPPSRRDQLRRPRRPRYAWKRLGNDDDALVFVRVAVSAPLREACA